MEGHVKLLAWFNLAMGAIGVLIGLAFLAGGTILAGFIDAAAGTESEPGAFVVQLIAVALLSVLVLFSLPCLILGYGLLNFRPWARVFGIVVAAFNLLNVPIGTAISIYAFWVLLKPETEALFGVRPATA